MEKIDKESFKQKFKQIDTDNSGKISATDLRNLLAQFEIEQHQKTIIKMVEHLDYYRNGKSNLLANNSLKMSENTQKPAEINDNSSEEDSNSEDSKHQYQEPELKVNCEQALKILELLINPIKCAIWKLTAKFYSLQNNVLKLVNRSYFAIKDPGHYAKVNILIGQEKEKYNSNLRVRFQKKSSKPLPGEQVVARIKIQTTSIVESQFFSGLWTQLYELIRMMLEGELFDGPYVLSTIDIKPIVNQKSFELQIKSRNPQINELAQLLSSLPNIILKTQFLFEFTFDLKEIIENPDASLYDFLTKNARIKLNYQGSEYVSAIKEIMIGAEAFKDLSYVNDDQQSLQKIFFISMQSLELNLKFKNGSFGKGEQDSLRELLTMIMEQVRPLIKNLQEQSPDLYSMIVNAIKKQIFAEVHVYDYHATAEVFVKNLDKLFLQDSVVMKNRDQEKDEEESEEGVVKKNNSSENSKMHKQSEVSGGEEKEEEAEESNQEFG